MVAQRIQMQSGSLTLQNNANLIQSGTANNPNRTNLVKSLPLIIIYNLESFGVCELELLLRR